MKAKISKWFWKFVYSAYPRFLRLLEKVQFHSSRQDFLLGRLDLNFLYSELHIHLRNHGFEDVVLAWKDPGEILSMRKLDLECFQYHVRVFSDGEIRCHYEYSSEGNPWGHITEKVFEARPDHFSHFFGRYLIKHGNYFKNDSPQTSDSSQTMSL